MSAVIIQHIILQNSIGKDKERNKADEDIVVLVISITVVIRQHLDIIAVEI